MSKGTICNTASTNIIFFVLLFFQILTIIFWGNKRENLYWDEYFTLQNAHYVAYDFGTDVYIVDDSSIPFDQWIAGIDTKSIFLIGDEDLVVDRDLTFFKEKLYVFQAYRNMLNIWEGIWARGEFNKWVPISLNIILFILVQFLIYSIGKKFLRSSRSGIVAMAVYGFSAMAINVAIFIRMYMWLTLVCILFVYLHLLMYEQENKWNYFGYEILSFFLMYIGMRESELVCLYCGLISVCFALCYIFTKQIRKFFIYVSPIVLLGIIYILLRYKYIPGTFQRALRILNDEQYSFSSMLKWTIKMLILIGKQLLGNIRILFLFAIIVIINVVYSKVKSKSVLFADVSMSVKCSVWGTLAFLIAGIPLRLFGAFRYISFSFPTLIIGIVALCACSLQVIQKEKCRFLFGLYLAIYIVGLAVAYTEPTIENIYPGDSAILNSVDGYDVYVDTYFIWTVNEATLNISSDKNIYYRKNEDADFSLFPQTFVMWASALDNEYLKRIDEIEREGYSVNSLGQTYTSFVFVCSK